MSRKTRENEEILAKPKSWNEIVVDYSSLSDDENLPSSTTRRLKSIPLKRNNGCESEPEDPCHGRAKNRFRRRQSRRRVLGRSRRRTKKPRNRSRSRKQI